MKSLLCTIGPQGIHKQISATNTSFMLANEHKVSSIKELISLSQRPFLQVCKTCLECTALTHFCILGIWILDKFNYYAADYPLKKISNERLCQVQSYSVYRLPARPDFDLLFVEEDYDRCHFYWSGAKEVKIDETDCMAVFVVAIVTTTVNWGPALVALSWTWLLTVS